MSAFINPTDYEASIHSEILDTLTRSDPSAVELAEDFAIDEMRGYLNARYDCNAIFNAAGDNRSKIVLLMAIDITLYHLHSAHNPMRFPPVRKDRYERAVEWLKMVQRGDINPAGLPLITDNKGNTGSAQTISITSNTKRGNHY